MGRLTQKLAPTEKVTPVDFYWAAGFYEGEGSITWNHGSTDLSIAQNNLYPLERMRALFGGCISPPNGEFPNGRKRTAFMWQLHGARARGLIMSIYGLLSPQRQEQVRKAMRIGEFSIG